MRTNYRNARTLSLALVLALLLSLAGGFTALGDDNAAGIMVSSYTYEEYLVEQQNPFTQESSTSDLTATNKILKDVTLVAEGGDAAITLKNLHTGDVSVQTISAEGTTIAVPVDDAGALLLTTLTVDGVQHDFYDFSETPIPAGSETVITCSENVFSLKSEFGPGEGVGVYETFRSAIYVGADGIVDQTASVLDAVTGDFDASATSIADIGITSKGDLFNGILVNGAGTSDAPYRIANVTLDLDGNGGDDFNGWGAGIMVTGGAHVEIDSASILSKGALRTAIWASSYEREPQGPITPSYLHVANSVIVGLDGTDTDDLKVPMMAKVPWALGLEGNNRITGDLHARATYTDSIVVAEGWGAISTDSGSTTRDISGVTVTGVLSGIGYLTDLGAMDAAEADAQAGDYTAIKQVGDHWYGFTVGKLGENSGYVSYSDQGIKNTYIDSEFYCPDYVLITAAGPSSSEFDNVTAVSQRGGIMWHQTSGGETKITGSNFTVADTMFLIKSQLSDTSGSNAAYTDIVVEDSVVTLDGENAQSGVLLQLIPTDDTAGSPVAGSYTAPYEGPDAVKGEVYVMDEAGNPTEEIYTIAPVNASFTGIDIDGDIFNAMQYAEQALNISFTDAKITGVISSSWCYHVDEKGEQYPEGTVLDDSMPGAYLYGGRVVNVASETVDNPVHLVLSGTTWNVTGSSYLSSLTIDSASTIVPADDVGALKISLDGAELSVADIVDKHSGTITGAITIEAE